MWNQYLFSIIFIVVFVNIISGKSITSHETINDLIIIRSCNETSPIDLDTMNEVLINKNITGSKTNAFKCFLHCLYTKYGWMDTDGGFLVTHMKRMLEETLLEETTIQLLLYKCTAIESVDPCQRAYIFTRCFWMHSSQKQQEENPHLIYNFE